MGLFDQQSPDQVRRDIRKEGMMEDASRGTGWQAISRAAAQGGRQLGQALGGQEDPRIAEAKASQRIQQEMMQEGWESKTNTPEFFMEGARKFAAAGQNKMAMKFAQEGQKLQAAGEDRSMKLEDRALGNELKQARIDKLGQPTASTSTPLIKNYEYLKANNPEKAEQYLTKQLSVGVKEGKLFKESNSDGTTTLHDKTGARVATLNRDGVPTISLASTREGRIDKNQGERIRQRDENIELRAKSLKLRQDIHVDALYGEYSDDFRQDTAVLKSMAEEAEGALAILSQDRVTPADGKLLQRFMFGLKKSNSKAQSEIAAWKTGEVGDLAERIEGFISGFITGEYSDNELNALSGSVQRLIDNHINPSYAIYDNFYGKKAERRGMNKDEIIRDRRSQPKDNSFTSSKGIKFKVIK